MLTKYQQGARDMLQQITGLFVRFTWDGSEMIRIAPASIFTGSAWVS